MQLLMNLLPGVLEEVLRSDHYCSGAENEVMIAENNGVLQSFMGQIWRIWKHI